MTRPFKPHKLPALIPYLIVKDATESVHFYQNTCQFTLMNEPKMEDNKILHAEMRLGDAVIMMASEGAWGSMQKSPQSLGITSSITNYIYVPDVDAHYEHAKAQQANIVKAPEDMFWGDRCYQLQDSDGYEWSFATHMADHP